MAANKNKLLTVTLLTGAFFVFLFLLLISYNYFSGGKLGLSSGKPRIAIVELTGPIYESRPIIKQFKRFAADDDIDAILFRISSPGGGVSASQEIYEEVRRIRDSGKIIVASMGPMAASGGYYVALGANKIMSSPATVTGSIGVIVGLPNYEGLMKKLGLGFENITSGPRKDSGSPYRKFEPDDRKIFQDMVDDLYAQFVNAVSVERGIPMERVRELADGRIYSGSQAKELGLVDTLGTYDDAIDYAVELANKTGEPTLIKARKRRSSLIDLLFGDARNLIDILQPTALPEYKLNVNF